MSRRHRVGRAPPERPLNSACVTALERTLREFPARANDDVIVPEVGVTFDSIGEAYDFYNLVVFMGTGFGVRYGKSHLNIDRVKCMQEIVCGCSGRPRATSSHSTRCLFPALIRLLRSKDNGWYICEHRDIHNHDLSASFGERAHWPSHKHIDSYTKDLVKQLRENNVNLGKVYSIIGSFFGKMENAPFTKRALKTVCGKISSEQADDDVRKTIEVFSEIGAADPDFGDAITSDTTYITNVYDMPFGLIIGVNNHFQSAIFGRVLLREEKVENFEWVFREFVKMMGGKNPVTVQTDQCRAMEVAISNVLPGTNHRWYKWHVLRKAKERLGALYGKNCQFKVDFHRIVNQMLTTEEFEGAWVEMLSSVRVGEKSLSAPLGGVVYKVGEPMEKHAAKVYTRIMFEKFQESVQVWFFLCGRGCARRDVCGKTF